MSPQDDRAPLGLVQQHALLSGFAGEGRPRPRAEAVLHLTGALDVEVLRTALALLWERHEAVRAGIEFDEEAVPRHTLVPAHVAALRDAALTTELDCQNAKLFLRWDPARLDERSMLLLITDLVVVYESLVADAHIPPPASVHMGHEVPASAARRVELAYWTRTRPFDPQMAEQHPVIVPLALLPNDPTAVTAVAAAVVCVLARYTHEPEITIGTLVRLGGPSALGSHTEPRRLHFTITDSTVFRTLVDGVTEQSRRAEPGAMDTAPNPLGKVLVRHDQLTGQRFHGAGTEFHVVEMTRPPDPADVTITICTITSRLRIDWQQDVCTRAAVQGFAEHLTRVLTEAVRNPDTPLARLPILTDAERVEARAAAQGPRHAWNRAPVHRQVAAQAAATPDAVAVRFDGTDLSYADLDARANQLAHHLRDAGIGAGDIVAILLGPCPEVLIAQLGVLKAGAAFVMSDPTHPPRRVRYVLEDSAAAAVITRSDLVAELAAFQLPRVELDRDHMTIAGLPATPPADHTDETYPAYLIYTSGSTGQPKGAVLTHAAMSNFLLWLGELFALGGDDRLLLHMALVFDFSHGEIFAALTRGATLVVANSSARTSPTALRELIVREEVTYLGGTPSLLGLVDAEPYPHLRYLLVGGESIPGSLVERWNLPGRRLVSIYGPTETAVGCLEYECEHTSWAASPPIGHPTANREVHVLDRWHDPAPVGVPGEVHVGGLGVGLGYHNRPGLTARRFIPDPAGTGGRLYATGDLATRGDDGEIRFIGRIDNQVKINGLRIELEEVEAALTRHTAVRRAAVVPVAITDTSSSLVAYFIAAKRPCTPEVLRAHLAADLPTHMIPSRFIEVDAFRLSSSGKVDRAALRSLHLAAEENPYTPPRTWAEKQVAEVFSRVTGRAAGADDPFPSDDPLDAMRAAMLLERLTGTTITVDRLLGAKSVASVAEELTPRAGALAEDDELAALLDLVESLQDEDIT